MYVLAPVFWCQPRTSRFPSLLIDCSCWQSLRRVTSLSRSWSLGLGKFMTLQKCFRIGLAVLVLNPIFPKASDFTACGGESTVWLWNSGVCCVMSLINNFPNIFLETLKEDRHVCWGLNLLCNPSVYFSNVWLSFPFSLVALRWPDCRSANCLHVEVRDFRMWKLPARGS